MASAVARSNRPARVQNARSALRCAPLRRAAPRYSPLAATAVLLATAAALLATAAVPRAAAALAVTAVRPYCLQQNEIQLF